MDFFFPQNLSRNNFSVYCFVFVHSWRKTLAQNTIVRLCYSHIYAHHFCERFRWIFGHCVIRSYWILFNDYSSYNSLILIFVDIFTLSLLRKWVSAEVSCFLLKWQLASRGRQPMEQSWMFNFDLSTSELRYNEVHCHSLKLYPFLSSKIIGFTEPWLL